MPKLSTQSFALLMCFVSISVLPLSVAWADSAPVAQPDQASMAKKWQVNQPPGTPKMVQIDTKTGTWMSVDVSPDGQQLVFDLLGDLYLLPIAGGVAQALTHSMAWEMQPRFSPDGQHITFMSDAGGGDNIWRMRRDGSDAQAVSKESFRLLNNPVWHPHGEYIAARKHFTGSRSAGSGEIWLYHKDGGTGVQLNEKPNWQKDLGEPAFSPDGRYLYYSQDTTSGTVFEYNKNSHNQIYQIFRRDLQEGKTISLVRGAGGAVRPTPSPDGRYLAFVRRVRGQSSLFVKNLQNGVETPVWDQLERDMQESWAIHGVYPAFAWLPGSREIVVWAKGRLWRLNLFADGKQLGRASAQEIPFQVKHSREIRPALRFAHQVAAPEFEVRQLRWVQVAPQGDKVVFSAMGHVYLKDLPNGKPRRLTRQQTHFEFYPRFSRDGKAVVFVTWHDSQLGSVRVWDLASGKETVISKEPGKYLEPTFAPDGKQVAYVKAAGGYLTTPWYGLHPGVYLAAVDGRTPPRLLTDQGRAPQFAQDANQLYITRAGYTNEVEEYANLVQLRLDTNEQQVIAKSDSASEYAISPDGRQLAFIDHQHVYWHPLPLAGKPLEIGKAADKLPQYKLDVNAGQYLHWSGDSRKLYFSLGDELFVRDLAEVRRQALAAEKAPELADAKSPAKPQATPNSYLPTEQGQKIGWRSSTAKPSGTVVLSGAQIITMRGDEIIPNGRIVIRDNRIIAVGAKQAIPLPEGAQEFDVSGKTIIPGLVDVHWHGAMGEDGIIPQQSWVNMASLAFGVTTLHDPSNNSAQIFTQAEMQKAGLITAPRIYSTGTILYGAKGNGYHAGVNSLEDALTHLKRMRAMGAISVKSYNQPRRDQRQQIIEAARQTGLMVVPEGGALFQHNMTMVIDGHTGVEHALPVENVYEDVKQLWAQTKVGYTPTLGVAYGGLDGEHYWYAHSEVWQHPLLTRHVPYNLLAARAVRRELAPEQDYNVFKVARAAWELAQRGVKVNMGAHGQREGLAAHWEMWTMAKAGMPALQVLRFATLNGAQYLGLEQDLGSLEVGKLADLVVIDGDVLQDIRQSDRVQYVMQNGRLYDAASMHQLAPEKRARAAYFFETPHGSSMPIEFPQDEHGHAHSHREAVRIADQH